MPRSPKVPFPSRLGFGIGDLSFVLIWQGTALFLMYFYTDVMGIAPAVAGAIYLVAMIWDAITDPIIATLAERARVTRWGKYRPWLLFGAVPLAVSYPLAFSTPGPLEIDPVVWALVTHLLLRTAYTLVSMPFNALQARLTDDAQERAVLAGFRMAGAASGGLMVAVMTPVMVSLYGPGREADAYFAAACLGGVITFVSLGLCFAFMREPHREDDHMERPPFLQDLAQMGPLFLRNPPLIRVFSVIILGSVCIGMFSKNVLYHFKYDLVQPDLVVWALTLPAMLLIATVPFWVWLAGKRSKRDALAGGISIALVGYLVFYFYSGANIVLIMTVICVIGFGVAALPVMYWSMLPDTIEYGEAMLGVRAEAKTFGFAAFAQKAAIGINALLLGQLLGWAGFEANVDQSEATLAGMKAIMALIPALGCVAILLIIRGYELDRARHAELVEIASAHREQAKT
ncbi:MAG: glycoside-pentoside-hexuronide (GPH):cation symporter [Erythrobacter sp.]|uniref:MFS transporter n=1 Tax=Erythrobacter sp. TaxID=1042 RepID=UPI00261EA738|nr:glycoside-pentoside-hexuronide (GPH):cation symporter [Erythrobacter sp.]MDJ0977305.1 glycoside-pentoside-hexuronide (GPH):cation symporter [Erythrobacter sp.]